VERWISYLAEQNPALADKTDITKGSGAEWLKDWRSNTPDDQANAPMPCMWVCSNNRKLGDEVDVQGVTWTVDEVVE